MRLLKEKQRYLILTLLILFILLSLIVNDYFINVVKHVSFKENHDKWIVLTTINNPTKQLDTLSNQKGFKLLAIADSKTNKTWYHSDATIYISLQAQLKLNYKSIKTTPFNSYTRKNIGYLFAIENGAKFIYDTDDDNEPLVDLNNYFDFDNKKNELEYGIDSPVVLNPYAHFGQPTIWPRGYPLSHINKKVTNNYICSKKPTSIIQQSVVNGDPDVDAIFRLTKTLDYKRIDIKFDDSAPSVRIPLFKITPFNSQNTFFHYKAFWSLYLPHSVSFRLTDIWRSYWTQRLMWLLDSTVSFHGPNAYQLRNSHSYLNDYKQEKEMYLKTEDLIQFLYKWKCKYKKFYLCVIDLSKQMSENSFWLKNELESIKNWLEDLNAIGYVEPTITNFNYEKTQIDLNAFLIGFDNKTTETNFKVRFTPNFEVPIDIDNYFDKGDFKMKMNEKIETFEYFKDFCKPNYELNYKAEKLLLFQDKKDITLLITFNHEPALDNIVFLQFFYKSYFKNIAFCGKNIMNVIKPNEKHIKKFDSYTLIDYDTIAGNLHYNCMSKVIEMNIKTNGILLMSDDMLLKYWNLDNSITDKIWLPYKPICNFDLNPDTQGKWPHPLSYWMATNFGFLALKNTFNYLEAIKNCSIKSDTKSKIIITNYLRMYKLKQNQPVDDLRLNKICKEPSDFFYVPKKYFFEFHVLSQAFSSRQVFLDFAVPTILTGIDAFNFTEFIQAKYVWENQFNFEKDYSSVKHIAHPFKLAHYKSSTNLKMMCETFIQDKFNFD